MSRRLTITFFILAILFASAWVYEKRIPEGTPATHSSFQNGLKSTSLKYKNDLIVRTSKLAPAYKLKISNIQSGAVPANDVFTLEAIITSDNNISKLNYQWILPEGVSLANGSSELGTIQNVSAKAETKLMAQFVQRSNNSTLWTDENKIIHLKVWQSDMRDSQIVTAQYNTVRQDEINRELEVLAQRNSEYIIELQAQIKKNR